MASAGRMERVLIVAATERELVSVEPARALEEERPSGVLHVGIAGAHGVAPLTLVLGSEAVYCDAAGPLVPARALPDPDLLARLSGAFPDALVLPIGTSARV